MHPYPHIYRVAATGTASGTVSVTSESLPPLETTPPPQFDGPEGFWSPETLLCASIADCVILTFRSVSRMAKLEWHAIECSVEGTLERRDNALQFTAFKTIATLRVPASTDAAKARALLERAEHVCLISNSLKGERTLEANVIVGAG